jgi:unsaturated rhamnogalacturonyl hydrolase
MAKGRDARPLGGTRAPAAPAATCLRVSAGDEFVRRVATYIRDEAPRTRAGVLSHLGVLAGGLATPQAWIDTVFMHGVFLNRLYASGDDWAGPEAHALALAMTASLGGDDAGLFRHASFDLGPLTLVLPVEPMFWARGNGWLIYFLVDHQVARQRRGLAPDPKLAELLGAQAKALLACQHTDGLWRTDLMGPASRENPAEVSASALILAALLRARRAKLLPEIKRVPLLNGRRALRKAIRWDRGHPTLTGVSTGTMPGFRRYYRAVPMDENVAHGVGAVLLALSQPEPM